MAASDDILGLVPTMQSLALAGHTYGFAKKKKKTTQGFVKTGVDAIVGTSLIDVTADFI